MKLPPVVMSLSHLFLTSWQALFSMFLSNLLTRLLTAVQIVYTKACHLLLPDSFDGVLGWQLHTLELLVDGLLDPVDAVVLPPQLVVLECHETSLLRSKLLARHYQI